MSRRRLFRLAAVLVAAALYGAAVWWCDQAQTAGQWVHVALTEGVDTAALEALRWQAEEETVGFCFWGETENLQVLCRQTGAGAQVTRVALWGNPELLEAGPLAWREGCLLDEDTAQRLFGTTQCAGQDLWVEGEVYPVLGTISTMRPTLVTMAEPGDVLGQCLLALPAEEGQTQAEQFLLRWGMGGEVLDFFPLLALAENLLLLFPGVLLLSVCSRLGRGWRGLRRSLLPRQKGLLTRVALALLLAVVGSCLLLSRVVIPRDAVPSQWSDFDFWGRLWERRRENLSQIAFAHLGSQQLQMLLDVVKSTITAMASAVLTAWMARRRDHADTAHRG